MKDDFATRCAKWGDVLHVDYDEDDAVGAWVRCEAPTREPGELCVMVAVCYGLRDDGPDEVPMFVEVIPDPGDEAAVERMIFDEVRSFYAAAVQPYGWRHVTDEAEIAALPRWYDFYLSNK